VDRTVAGIVGDQPVRLESLTEGLSSTASMDPQQLWQVAQEELRFQVVRPGYEAWLANAVLVESEDPPQPARAITRLAVATSASAPVRVRVRVLISGPPRGRVVLMASVRR